MPEGEDQIKCQNFRRDELMSASICGAMKRTWCVPLTPRHYPEKVHWSQWSWEWPSPWSTGLSCVAVTLSRNLRGPMHINESSVNVTLLQS